MNRKVRFAFLLLCIAIAVAGCSKKNKKIENNILNYYEDAQIVRLGAGIELFELVGQDAENIFFITRSEDVNNSFELFRNSLEDGKERELLISKENAFFVDMAANSKEIVCLYAKEKGDTFQYSISVYDCITKTESIIDLNKLSVDNLKNVITMSDSTIFLANNKKVIQVSATGQEIGTFVSADSNIIDVKSDGKNLFILEGEKSGKKNALYTIDSSGNAVKKYNKTDSICLFAVQDGRISFVDSEGISIENSEGEINILVGANDSQAFRTETVDLIFLDESIRVLSYNSDRTCAKVTTFFMMNEKEDINTLTPSYDKSGRTFIYLYDSGNYFQDNAINPVDVFNELNDKYQIVIKNYSFATDNEQVFDAARMIADGELPDIIFSTYNAEVDYLLKNNCLEDLNEYMEKDNTLDTDLFQDNIINAYTKNGILFALSDYCYLNSLYGAQNTLGEGTWTVEEFLDWIANHPNVNGVCLSRRQVYDACIPSIMQRYVDLETHKADFINDEFENILKLLKKTNRKNEYSFDEVKELLDNEDERISDLIYSPGSLTVLESQNKMKLVVKGYPTDNEYPLTYISSPAMSILSSSENKEGAYEFIRFYLLYSYSVIGKEAGRIGSTKFYTYSDNYYQGIHDLLQADNYLGTPLSFEKESIDLITQLFDTAVLRDYSNCEIEDIIYEEIQSYIDNEKDEADVMRVIQSRVQLYLDEHS